MSKNIKKIEDGLKAIFKKKNVEWLFDEDPLFSAHAQNSITKDFKKRLEMGEEKYGEEWKIRDNLIEAEDELLDAIAYLIFESKKETKDSNPLNDTLNAELEEIVEGILRSLHRIKKTRMIKESNLFLTP